ncbi:MAG: CYTH domain-containing protein [Candidatus Aenigmatarchaeota archaeon]
MENIEAEVRSFITEEQYRRLLDFFRQNSKPVKEDYQESYYFAAPIDLRIQKNSKGAKLWAKAGKIHDDSREETEVWFGAEEFGKLEMLFNSLGFPTSVKWFRHRKQFDWNGIKVCLDDTKGYGRIIELEKMCDEGGRENALKLLREKMAELNVMETPREEFDAKFEHYRKNWKALTEV